MSDEEDYGTPPWEAYPHIWKTKAAWFAYLRGILRRGWSISPVKLEFIKENRFKAVAWVNKNGKPKYVYMGHCKYCDKNYKQGELEVNHKRLAGSLKDYGDIKSFVLGLLHITSKDLEFICKPCHKILSYSQRHDLSFEEAKLAKLVIARMKKPIDEQKHEITLGGKLDIPVGNKEQRKEAYKQLIKKEIENNE